IILRTRKQGFLQLQKEFTKALEDLPITKLKADVDVPDTWIQWLFGEWHVFVSNPKDIESILTKTNDSYLKVPIHERNNLLATKFLGVNVFTASNKAEWLHHRKVVNPFFKEGWDPKMFGTLAHTLLRQLDGKTEGSVDPLNWMQRMTLDALSTTIFGDNLNTLVVDHPLVQLYNRILDSLFDPIHQIVPYFSWIPLPSLLQTHWDIYQFNLALRSMVQLNDHRHNLIQALLQKHMENPSYTLEDIRADMVAFFVAGHDTTASALTMAIYLLGIHQEVQEKARAQVHQILGPPNDTFVDAGEVPIPSLEELAELEYVANILQETLRIYPSVPAVLRQSTKSMTLHDGTVIPPKTKVVLAIRNTQRRKEGWHEDKDKFRPERWETSNILPHHSKYNWIPFGAGPRVCLGMSFSWMEQRVVLTMLLWRYSWRVIGNENALQGQPDSMMGVLFKPKNIQVQFTRGC
ncbi:hypothetical protein HMI55_001777, partial [Coelomomyces lativittatus]